MVFYGHDVHFHRLRLQAAATDDPAVGRDAAHMERLERWIWRSVDTTLYASEEETAIVAELEPGASVRGVTPFGFADFATPRPPPAGQAILFVGGFGHAPNEQALLWFVNEVLPLVRQRRGTARLLVAGSRPGPNVLRLARADISILPDLSQEALRGHYAAARVAVAPLQFGAGVKLKVVEALREGVPLVTTPIGAQGLPGLDTVASIAADPAGFADAVCRLLTDDLLWQQRCAGQLRYARARFSEQAMCRSFQVGLGLAWPTLHPVVSAA